MFFFTWFVWVAHFFFFFWGGGLQQFARCCATPKSPTFYGPRANAKVASCFPITKSPQGNLFSRHIWNRKLMRMSGISCLYCIHGIVEIGIPWMEVLFQCRNKTTGNTRGRLHLTWFWNEVFYFFYLKSFTQEEGTFNISKNWCHDQVTPFPTLRSLAVSH